MPVTFEPKPAMQCAISQNQYMSLQSSVDMYFSFVNKQTAILDASCLRGHHQNAIASIFGEDFLTQITGHLVLFTAE